MIYRCYNCKYINTDNKRETCPLCKSKCKFVFLNANTKDLTSTLSDYISNLNLKARTNVSLWKQKGMEYKCDPYTFFIEKKYGDYRTYIYDKNRIFIQTYNDINGKNREGDLLVLTEAEIKLTIMRIIFYGVDLNKFKRHGDYPMYNPTIWSTDIINKNVNLVLRDIKFLRYRNKVRNIETYDLYISPKLLAYLELFYNQGLINEYQFIRRQKLILELIDLYKDYSQWEKEYDELYTGCLDLLKRTEPSDSIKKLRQRRVYYEKTCPSCSSDYVLKYGTKTTKKGTFQMWFCRDCSKRIKGDKQ